MHSVDLENADPDYTVEFLSDLDRFQHERLCHHRGKGHTSFSTTGQFLPVTRFSSNDACASPLFYAGLRGLFLADDLHLNPWVPSGENYAKLANRNRCHSDNG